VNAAFAIRGQKAGARGIRQDRLSLRQGAWPPDEKLSALGLTPGSPARLLQKWPTCVVQCDETEIALEEELARNIYVWQTRMA
jgi:Fe2+ transport system protein FeoA